VQQFGWQVVVEIERGRADPVRLIAVHSEDSMQGRLTTGRGKTVSFDRTATRESIQRVLEKWCVPPSLPQPLTARLYSRC
jgi:hypothetical protein